MKKVCLALFVASMLLASPTSSAFQVSGQHPLPATEIACGTSFGNGYFYTKGEEFLIVGEEPIARFMKALFDKVPSGKVNIAVYGYTDRGGYVPYYMSIPRYISKEGSVDSRAKALTIKYNRFQINVSPVMENGYRKYAVSNSTSTEVVDDNETALAGAFERQIPYMEHYQSFAMSLGAFQIIRYLFWQ